MEKNSFSRITIRSRFPRNHFEQKAREYHLPLCGIDEVGRGPLAGPLVAAAVILKPRARYPGTLTDSKLLTPLQREVMFDWLQENSWYAVASVSARKIDEISLGTANIQAMQQALALLTIRHNITPACILVDALGFEVPWLQSFSLPESTQGTSPEDHLEYPWHKIISFYKGEIKSCSIAAASIIAKVTRDRLMKQMGIFYPNYLFDEHKGYATQTHYQQLTTHAPSIIHRKSFLKSYQDRVLQLSFGESQLDDHLPADFSEDIDTL